MPNKSHRDNNIELPKPEPTAATPAGDIAPDQRHPSLEKLENQLAIMQHKLDDAIKHAESQKNQALSHAAEVQNLKRIMTREVADARHHSLKKFITELLPMIDSLEHGLQNCQAVDAGTPADSLHHGMKLALQVLHKVFVQFDIAVLNPLGEKYDPNLHEAVSIQPDKSAKPETVITVVQSGYTIKGLVIRPARVIVTPK